MTDVSMELASQGEPSSLTDWRSATTTLYRMYDLEGGLPYVGISRTPVTRIGREHRAAQPWWIDVATVTMEHFDDRESAASAEVVAIQAESPRWNARSSLVAPRRSRHRGFPSGRPDRGAPSKAEWLAAYAALAERRWKCARADAEALVVRQHVRELQDEGAARPQAEVAEERGTNQQNVSRAVKRGDDAARDPERLRDAHAQAAAAGISPELLS